MFKRGTDREAGFTLIELIVTVLVTSLITLSAIMYFNAISREVMRPVITFDSQNYTLAPIISSTNDGVSKTDLFDAIDLHHEFSTQIYSADFVAVFGGANVNIGAPIPLQPLRIGFANTALPSIAAASPQSLLSTSQLASAASSDLSAEYDSLADSNAFTVLVFQGINEIVAIAQVRRYTTMYNDAPVVLYETLLRSRRLPALTWTTYAYRFWLPAAEDNWAIPMGARHYWYRYESSWWGRSEPTGSALVFPDPFVLSVGANDATVKPMSRFSYFVSASP